ncbi:MAG: PAS domain-containing protein [Desulfofustis sp.]|nr:PAS domain-containing protein [Desulfofustis sp.]
MGFPEIGKNRDEFEFIFKHIPMGIVYLDRNLKILNMNHYYQEKIGVSVEQVKNKYCYELRAELHGRPQRALKPCEDCMAPESIRTGEISTFIKEIIPGFITENTIIPVKDARGVVIGVIEMLRDITKSMLISRELVESEEKYKSVVDNLGIGVSLISPQMEILALNKQMNQWFPHIEVEKRPLCYREFNDPPNDDICSYCPTQKTLQDGGVHESVTATPLGDEIRNYRIISSPIKDWEGNVTGAIEMVEDITDKKRKEEELQKYRENLEAMVKERTEKLMASNEALKREIANRLEAEKALELSSEEIKHFAYSVSHDLKNPSIAIYGLTRLLTKNCDELLDERGRQYCQQILRSSEQITSLVEMINLYMSTKETTLSVDTINLSDLLVMIREEFAVPLNIRQIELNESRPLPQIRADHIAILRVLRNLVDNALKYGGETLTRIVIGYKETEEHHVVFVNDDGVGLTEEESQDVFGLFIRQKTAAGIAGTGLGLTIVKEIADQHGGKVWPEVSKDQGITFNVSISKHL